MFLFRMTYEKQPFYLGYVMYAALAEIGADELHFINKYKSHNLVKICTSMLL